jgi:hypothetical protein
MLLHLRSMFSNFLGGEANSYALLSCAGNCKSQETEKGQNSEFARLELVGGNRQGESCVMR